STAPSRFQNKSSTIAGPDGQGAFVSPGRLGPDWPGASRRYLVLGRLKTPAAGAQRSSSWSTASRSARVSTLRARARPPPFFRLLSSDIRKLPAHPTGGGFLYLLISCQGSAGKRTRQLHATGELKRHSERLS